jgi:hypothetical protein
MKKNNLVGSLVTLYIVLTVAPVVIEGADILIRTTAGVLSNGVKKVIANNKDKKACKEKNKDIIDVKYYVV